MSDRSVSFLSPVTGVSTQTSLKIAQITVASHLPHCYLGFVSIFVANVVLAVSLQAPVQ